MSQLSGAVVVAAQGLFNDSAEQLHRYGELVFSNDGRAFRYMRAGTTALVAGQLQQSRPEITANQNLTLSATGGSVGDVSLTTGSTVTVDANFYAGGWMVVNDNTGQGLQYEIKSHPAASSAALAITLADPINVAIAASSEVDLVVNPWKDIIVNPTTPTSGVVGVSVRPTGAGSYGWVQVSGVATLLADNAIVVGGMVRSSGTVAGAGAGIFSSLIPGAGTATFIGVAMTGITDTEYGAVKISGIL